jgi:hypothetical protein
MLSHAPSTAADQAHSLVAVTPTVPDPPSAGTLVVPVLRVIAQRSAVAGEVIVVLEEPQAAAVRSMATRENR